MKKKLKDEREKQDYFRMQKKEQEQLFKNKLRNQRLNDEEKLTKMRKKFEHMDDKYAGQKQGLDDHKEMLQETRF